MLFFPQISLALSSLSLISFSLALSPRWLLSSQQHWTDIWTATPFSAPVVNLPSGFNQTGAAFSNTTLRQTVHVTLGAPQIRITLSNNFGNQALNVTHMTVAYPDIINGDGNATGINSGTGSPSIITSSVQTVTFSGNETISIPNGALAKTDPINMPVDSQSQIAISIYTSTGQGGTNITGHLSSFTTTWFAQGDQTTTSDISTVDTVKSGQQWYFISAVEGWVGPQQSSLAIIGDSITDGVGSTPNGNNRWTDQLFARMQSEGDSVAKNVAIANQAWNGNKVLFDGSGASAISRVERDVLAQSGIAYAMVFDGVNDIGHTDDNVEDQQAKYDSLIQGYEQIITRIHAFGIPVFGATITPSNGPDYNATLGKYSGRVREQYRQKINDWIRNSGKYDYVVDFDAAVRNTTAPYQINSTLGIGDYLHFNPMGYRLFAEAFDLSVFSRFQGGVSGYQ
ncbi:uncharacterized protein I303_101376 [Kwoniella dejecticola CBS 10117]|uniref:SGNH hydrolase-type esterase domain-containing protein n=1 Tax=Kwoniella dejecticola CBS 10117 TaxID=1296121 RepID=A0A1A6AHK9_9TREE|nr:uncharacterized protein I303_01385 [Kwoniella dejecticola CBS 10117]OBR89557.1 hypothetical protein I303_01385 [Kwoniella dejecticola CBS 10117]